MAQCGSGTFGSGTWLERLYPSENLSFSWSFLLPFPRGLCPESGDLGEKAWPTCTGGSMAKTWLLGLSRPNSDALHDEELGAWRELLLDDGGGAT